MKSNFYLGGVFHTICLDRFGQLKWEDITKNLVVNTGINLILTSGFGTSYIGLLNGTPTLVAGDIMASHAGWTEITAYTATRPAYTNVITGTSMTNSASKATFNINGTVTVGGIFVCTNSTIGGTTGTLITETAFSTGNKSCINGDIIYIQYDFSGTSS